MTDFDALSQGAELFVTRLPSGQSFTWRLLTLAEYSKLHALRESQAMHELLFYSAVFDRCYAGDPRAINGDLPAGVFVAIGRLIMWLSGDSTGETQSEDLDLVREAYPANSVTEHIKHVILMAFTSYTPDDLDQWTRVKLLKTFAIAESVLVKRGAVQQAGYQPLDTRKIMTEEQIQKKEQIDYARDNAEINKAMSGQKHILDRDVDELRGAMVRRQKLERKEAQRLDQIMGSRGGK